MTEIPTIQLDKVTRWSERLKEKKTEVITELKNLSKTINVENSVKSLLKASDSEGRKMLLGRPDRIAKLQLVLSHLGYDIGKEVDGIFAYPRQLKNLKRLRKGTFQNNGETYRSKNLTIEQIIQLREATDSKGRPAFTSTQLAVLQFQSEHNSLPVNGIVGPLTIEQMGEVFKNREKVASVEEVVSNEAVTRSSVVAIPSIETKAKKEIEITPKTEKHRVTAKRGLNYRSQPTTKNNKPLGILKKGTILDVVGHVKKDPHWVKIKNPDDSISYAYVSSRYTEKIVPTVETSPKKIEKIVSENNQGPVINPKKNSDNLESQEVKTTPKAIPVVEKIDEEKAEEKKQVHPSRASIQKAKVFATPSEKKKAEEKKTTAQTSANWFKKIFRGWGWID